MRPVVPGEVANPGKPPAAVVTVLDLPAVAVGDGGDAAFRITLHPQNLTVRTVHGVEAGIPMGQTNPVATRPLDPPKREPASLHPTFERAGVAVDTRTALVPETVRTLPNSRGIIGSGT